MAFKPLSPIWPPRQEAAAPAESSAPSVSAQTRHRRSIDKPWERCAHHPVLPNVWACPACFVEMRELHRGLIQRLELIRSGQLTAADAASHAAEALSEMQAVYSPSAAHGTTDSGRDSSNG